MDGSDGLAQLRGLIGRIRSKPGWSFAAVTVVAFGLGIGLGLSIAPEPEQPVPPAPVVEAPLPPIGAQSVPLDQNRLAGLLAPAPSPGAVRVASLAPPIAEPLPPDPDRPRIAIVLDDVGINKRLAAQAIALDPGITLAFLPYADGIAQVVDQARAAGHEILLHMPMEPHQTETDPGPRALLTSMDTVDMVRQFEWALSRVVAPVGFNNHMGSKMTESRPHMLALMAEARRRKLMFLDSRTTADTVAQKIAAEMGMPHASRDVFLDNDRTPATIAEQLAKAEKIATRHGQAIAIGHPYAETLDVLAQWLSDLDDRGFDLVPVSALMDSSPG